MIGVLKVVGIVLVLLLLVRKKWDLALVLFVGTVLAGLLFRMTPAAFGRSLFEAIKSWDTISLVLTIGLVLYLGGFMKARGHFRMMVDALNHLLPEARLILALPPALIGLLPMLGGALMSAPIVDEAGRRWDLKPAWKTFYNYWFRHIMEYTWPLYVNLILAATITRIPVSRISVHQLPFTLLALTVGLVLLFKNVPSLPHDEKPDASRAASAGRFVLSLWPILLALVFIFGFRFSIVLSLAATAAATQLLSRLSLRARGKLLLKSLSLKTILLMVSVMVFKRVLETSGAMAAVTQAIRPEGAGAYVLLFAVPFLLGFLTGVNHVYVGVSFPMLMPIFGPGHPDIVLVLFAYISGFVGILLSPAHLCLVLTADYFRAELKDVYRILWRPALIIFLAAFLVLLVLRIL